MPRIKGTPKIKITFRIGEEYKKQIIDIAKAKNYDFTELIRKIVENYAKNYQL